MTPKKNHEPKCRCSTCEAVEAGMTPEQAIEQRRQWENQMLQEYGWFVHYVGHDPDVPYNFNAHTHGLLEGYGHLDLQVVFPLREDTCHSILATLAERIKAGEKFHHGQRVEKVIGNNLQILLHEAIETGRPVLRIILPDKEGNLDANTLTDVFKNQYADLTSENHE